MLNLFSVGVKDVGVFTHITGVSFRALSTDIEKFFSTSLITKYMSRRETWDTIKIHNFFLVELRDILGQLLQVRNLRSRRRDLAELKHKLETETWIKDTVNPLASTFDFSKLNRFHTKLFPVQRDFLEHYSSVVKSYHLKGLALDGRAGSGKAMPLHTLVKVPGGWQPIGDLKIGSPVIGPKGNTATVTGVYPQGVTDVYRFTLEDGRTVESHPEHLWEVYEDDLGTERPNPRQAVTTTQDIVNHFLQFSYHLPLVGEIGGLDPDSTTDTRQMAEGLFASEEPMDASILELPYNDRFSLVEELLQTSGCHVSEGEVSFVANGPQLAKDFQKLIWSIGGVACATERGGLHFITFKHRDLREMIDTIFHHVEVPRYENVRLRIMAVCKVDPQETLCISIDSEDKLFVVDDYVVTHNTFTAIAWAALVSDEPTMILATLATVDEVWVKELHKHHKVAPKIWTSKMNAPIKEGYDYYVVHHDVLQSQRAGMIIKFLQEYVKKNKRKLKLIIDESHNFNELKAKQTRTLIEWGDKDVFSDVLPMSGTLFKALGSEVYPIMCLIDTLFDRIARPLFLASYGRNRPALMELLARRIGRSKFTILEINGMGDPPPFEIIKVRIPNGDKYTLDAIRLEMQSYIAQRMAFYNKHMPEFVTFYNDVVTRYEFAIRGYPKELAALQRYKQIVNRFRSQGYNNFTDSADSVFCKSVEVDIERGLKGKELSDFRSIKSAVKYLGLKIRGEALGNVLGRARINAIKDMIVHAGLPELINNVEKKTLIFTSYIESLQLAQEYLVSKGFNPITVYGDNNSERDRSVEKLRSDTTVNPLITTYESLREGVPLVMANQTIGLDAPFRDHVIKQVTARTWRHGQDSECFYWMLDMDTGDKLNITSRSIDILSWSKEQVDVLLGRMDSSAVFASVTGEEAWAYAEEGYTQPLRSSNSVLELFL